MKLLHSSPSRTILFLGLIWSQAISHRVNGNESPGQWILVAPQAFHSELKPLVERRKSEGFEVEVVESAPTLGRVEPEAGIKLLERLRGLLKESGKPRFVLLAGSYGEERNSPDAANVVPGLSGKVGRMTGQFCDFGYGLPGADGAPKVAVGRFLARNTAELGAMVRKTLEFERNPESAAWRDRLILMLGNPGGGKMAEWYVSRKLQENLGFLHPLWAPRIHLEVESSPFFLPLVQNRNSAIGNLRQGALFSIYLGHSGAMGMGLDDWFMTRQDWANLKIPSGRGPFFTCGCFANQRFGPGGEGYGCVAARNPDGPVAVIGATGESYSAPGQLAAEGLLACLKRPPFPLRLGDYWLSVQAGLASGAMDESTFALLDRVDGSGGKVPLSVQRLEHLEMWQLLGDPALLMPVVPADVSLRVSGSVGAGKTILVSGELPDRLSGATVEIRLERPLDSKPAGIEKVPANKPENQMARNAVFERNHQRANSFVLGTVEAHVTGRQFTANIEIPVETRWSKLILKARSMRGKESGCGAVTLSCEPSAERK